MTVQRGKVRTIWGMVQYLKV